MDEDYVANYGINLANYVPKKRNFDSIVYVHKRLLDKTKKDKEKVEKEKKEKEVKPKKYKKKGKNIKCDKYQQCGGEFGTEFNNEMLSALSMQVAHTIMPVILPANGKASPVYYTIKASKKPRKQSKVDASTHTNMRDVTYKKEKSKKVIETYRRERGSQKESLSIKETVSYSSNCDTLDELHINPSLCCTFSDFSDQKQAKKENRDKTKYGAQKILTSESFEAFAAEFLNTPGDSKIKIHLMNETEKNLLTENIRVPLLNAIRECISEINSNSQLNTELVTVQKIVACNTEKLDNVVEKLTSIEQKIDHIVTETEKNKAKSPRRLPKPSSLENFAQDRLERVEDTSEDEFYARSLEARKRLMNKTFGRLRMEVLDREREAVGGGETTAEDQGQSFFVQPDRPNRIPARFCWTDTTAGNNTK